jgi:hypothetical protein
LKGQHKREDKTTEQYLKDLVGGITIGVPELNYIKSFNIGLNLDE